MGFFPPLDFDKRGKQSPKYFWSLLGHFAENISFLLQKASFSKAPGRKAVCSTHSGVSESVVLAQLSLGFGQFQLRLCWIHLWAGLCDLVGVNFHWNISSYITSHYWFLQSIPLAKPVPLFQTNAYFKTPPIPCRNTRLLIGSLCICIYQAWHSFAPKCLFTYIALKLNPVVSMVYICKSPLVCSEHNDLAVQTPKFASLI